MHNYSLIAFLLFISCQSPTSRQEPKTESLKKDTLTISRTLPTIEQHKDSAIIYDTLVFTDAMNGEALAEKYKSSQPELTFFKQFIAPQRINKLKVLKGDGVKTEVRYLGTIKDLKNYTSYHVVTRFRIIGIGQMSSPRGRSDVAFIIPAENKILVYNLSMPHDLPKYIKNNKLYFEFKSTKAGISISGGLPPMLCLPEIGCN